MNTPARLPKHVFNKLMKNPKVAIVVIVLALAGTIYSKFSEQSSNLTAASSHSIKNYEDARSIFWKQLYNTGGETLYCGQAFGSGYNKGINVEHVFPMSWVTHTLNCGTRKQCRENSDLFNRIEADLHNLYPARSDINEERSSIAFGMINGEKRLYGACDFEVQHSRPRLVEPREPVRGEIARAMLYMADTYDLKLFDKQRAQMEAWNRQDPPDETERRRNDKIEQIQGNRNPYID